MNYLTFEQVKKMTGLSRTTIWRLEKLGEFPKRRQLTVRRVGWDESEVRGWRESRPNAEQEGEEAA
jgi:prophage regulatory protein